MAKQPLLEAWCPQCKEYYYSDVFNEDCAHYCPECGEKMRLTGKVYHLMTQENWEKWRRCTYKEKSHVLSSGGRAL